MKAVLALTVSLLTMQASAAAPRVLAVCTNKETTVFVVKHDRDVFMNIDNKRPVKVTRKKAEGFVLYKAATAVLFIDAEEQTGRSLFGGLTIADKKISLGCSQGQDVELMAGEIEIFD